MPPLKLSMPEEIGDEGEGTRAGRDNSPTVLRWFDCWAGEDD